MADQQAGQQWGHAQDSGDSGLRYQTDLRQVEILRAGADLIDLQPATDDDGGSYAIAFRLVLESFQDLVGVGLAPFWTSPACLHGLGDHHEGDCAVSEKVGDPGGRFLVGEHLRQQGTKRAPAKVGALRINARSEVDHVLWENAVAEVLKQVLVAAVVVLNLGPVGETPGCHFQAADPVEGFHHEPLVSLDHQIGIPEERQLGHDRPEHGWPSVKGVGSGQQVEGVVLVDGRIGAFFRPLHEPQLGLRSGPSDPSQAGRHDAVKAGVSPCERRLVSAATVGYEGRGDPGQGFICKGADEREELHLTI